MLRRAFFDHEKILASPGWLTDLNQVAEKVIFGKVSETRPPVPKDSDNSIR